MEGGWGAMEVRVEGDGSVTIISLGEVISTVRFNCGKCKMYGSFRSKK